MKAVVKASFRRLHELKNMVLNDQLIRLQRCVKQSKIFKVVVKSGIGQKTLDSDCEMDRKKCLEA
jgi:hypothetical protein